MPLTREQGHSCLVCGNLTFLVPVHTPSTFYWQRPRTGCLLWNWWRPALCQNWGVTPDHKTRQGRDPSCPPTHQPLPTPDPEPAWHPPRLTPGILAPSARTDRPQREPTSRSANPRATGDRVGPWPSNRDSQDGPSGRSHRAVAFQTTAKRSSREGAGPLRDPVQTPPRTAAYSSRATRPPGLAHLPGRGHLPPPLLGEVRGHPLHLLQQVVPVRLGARGLLQFGQSPEGPQAFFPQICDALMDLVLLPGAQGRGRPAHDQKRTPLILTPRPRSLSKKDKTGHEGRRLPPHPRIKDTRHRPMLASERLQGTRHTSGPCSKTTGEGRNRSPKTGHTGPQG